MPHPHTWLDEVLAALEAIGGTAHLSEIYAEVERRDYMDFIARPTWQAAVRETLEKHSSDSDAFLHNGDYFYSVEGIGNGVWGIRP
jgi:hypothetical protein